MSNDTKNYYEDAAGWHEDVIRHKEQQIQLFQKISFGLFACLIISLIGLTTLISREKVLPFLALMDKRTGEVTTATPLKEQTIKDNWPMIRHFVGGYVKERESYNFLNINEPYEKVMAMSSPNIRGQVDQYIRPELNEESPIKAFGRNYYQNVNIHSISKLEQNNLLDVRFTTNVFRVSDNKKEASKDWRVVIRYELVSAMKSLKEWDKNPMGFKITFYDKQPVI